MDRLFPSASLPAHYASVGADSGKGGHMTYCAAHSKAGGGSCFGDSGGSAFFGRYVIGDASYVNSLSCNATASYQRVDTPYARAFLEQFS